MIVFEYKCSDCNSIFEESVKEGNTVYCLFCSSKNVERTFDGIWQKENQCVDDCDKCKKCN